MKYTFSAWFRCENILYVQGYMLRCIFQHDIFFLYRRERDELLNNGTLKFRTRSRTLHDLLVHTYILSTGPSHILIVLEFIYCTLLSGEYQIIYHGCYHISTMTVVNALTLSYKALWWYCLIYSVLTVMLYNYQYICDY